MFTGIIEEIGIVREFSKLSNGAVIEIECNIVLDGTKIGDSISVNGVCETVTEITPNSFKAKLSEETLNITVFGELKIGSKVNLERALLVNLRFGGHIVSGHVDCVGKLISVEKLTDFYNLEFEIPNSQAKYVIYKGSITVNGISLTISSIKENVFKAAIIPHTYENTNLNTIKIGDYVNIETDILGKYVEKLLSANDNKRDISIEFLKENGFV
ncbi:riboflavin synthase [bacterium]|nr:riboflavin synthase [bacterium]